jgi:hypothetical protein
MNMLETIIQSLSTVFSMSGKKASQLNDEAKNHENKARKISMVYNLPIKLKEDDRPMILSHSCMATKNLNLTESSPNHITYDPVVKLGGTEGFPTIEAIKEIADSMGKSGYSRAIIAIHKYMVGLIQSIPDMGLVAVKPIEEPQMRLAYKGNLTDSSSFRELFEKVLDWDLRMEILPIVVKGFELEARVAYLNFLVIPSGILYKILNEVIDSTSEIKDNYLRYRVSPYNEGEKEMVRALYDSILTESTSIQKEIDNLKSRCKEAMENKHQAYDKEYGEAYDEYEEKLRAFSKLKQEASEKVKAFSNTFNQMGIK